MVDYGQIRDGQHRLGDYAGIELCKGRWTTGAGWKATGSPTNRLPSVGRWGVGHRRLIHGMLWSSQRVAAIALLLRILSDVHSGGGDRCSHLRRCSQPHGNAVVKRKK